VREFPASPRRAAAALALARLRLDQRDVAAGCAALVESRAAVAADDLELRNQIEYQERRCESERAAVAARDEATLAATERSRTSGSSTASSKRGGTPAREPAASRATRPAAPTGRYTIQVAAFNTRDEAESLVDALRGRELQARIVGTKKPFRVRVGRYATRKAATAALAQLKSRKVTSSGFVTEAEAAGR
jgi:cell division septation protein DedD